MEEKLVQGGLQAQTEKKLADARLEVEVLPRPPLARLSKNSPHPGGKSSFRLWPQRRKRQQSS